MKKTMDLLVKFVIAAFLALFSETMNPQLQAVTILDIEQAKCKPIQRKRLFTPATNQSRTRNQKNGIKSKAGSSAEQTSLSQDILVIKNGMVIDGTGVDPIENGAVIVRGNRIQAVGKTADLVFPSTADIIDAKGQTILPGIINSHVHHAGPHEQRRRFLEAGVTSVCDLGSPQEEISLFQETQGAEGPTARGFYAGRIVTAPGGYPDGLGRSQGFNYEVSTPLEATKAVVDLVNQGAVVIKIALDPSWNFENPLPMLDSQTTQAIVREAHSQGKLVRAHMILLPSFQRAIQDGIDVVEHMPFPLRWPPDEEKKEMLDNDQSIDSFFIDYFPEYGTLLPRMAEQGIIMVPTVSTLLGNMYLKANPTLHERFVVMVILDIIRRFRAAGGVIAMGNDFNGRFIKEHMPLMEMRALLDAGLTPMEVIEAGTRLAARICGQEKELGTLEPGKLADIIIIDGNPLTDIEAFSRISHVIIDGKSAVSSHR